MNLALEKLKSLKNIYQDFEEVSAGEDLRVKLKLLSSEEETEVHGFCVEKYEQGIAYLYAVKRETLCRSIITMNEVEIPEFVEEKSEKVMRPIWLRENIVSGWNQILIDEIWRGYSRLMEKVENKINGSIKKENAESEANA